MEWGGEQLKKNSLDWFDWLDRYRPISFTTHAIYYCLSIFLQSRWQGLGCVTFVGINWTPHTHTTSPVDLHYYCGGLYRRCIDMASAPVRSDSFMMFDQPEKEKSDPHQGPHCWPLSAGDKTTESCSTRVVLLLFVFYTLYCSIVTQTKWNTFHTSKKERISDESWGKEVGPGIYSALMFYVCIHALSAARPCVMRMMRPAGESFVVLVKRQYCRPSSSHVSVIILTYNNLLWLLSSKAKRTLRV